MYVVAEKTPYTGIIENYKVPPISEEDSVLEGKIPFKNGVIDGYSKLYYPSGKLMTEESYKNDKLDGIVKRYDENGKLIEQETYKNSNRIK